MSISPGVLTSMRRVAGRVRRALRSAVDGSFHPYRRRRAVAQVVEAPTPGTVLILCLGNICRSPYAEARLRDALARQGMDVDVVSAGFMGPNRPPPGEALSAAAARGLDTRAHRSRLLTHDLVERADLTVLVEASHGRRITPRSALEGMTLVVLGDFDPDPVKSRTIPDPWGRSAEKFDEVFDRIDRCVEVLAKSLGNGRQEAASLGPARSRPGGRLPAQLSARVQHHFTVDVEEVFHSSLLTDRIPSCRWDDYPRRGPDVVRWLLDEMATRGVLGTFFVLGWMAEREPDLVQAIANAGHEIASHSWAHRRVVELSPDEFRESVRRTKQRLEDLTGERVTGYRAPSFSILPGTEWAFDVLIEEGYQYDSSLFPTRLHPGYGYPDAQVEPYLVRRPSGSLVEVPLLTRSVLGQRVPAAGGAYLRFLPYRFIERALLQAEERGTSGTLYVHPWDLDPGSLRLIGSPLGRLRLYGGTRRARARVPRLLSDFEFKPVSRSVEPLIACLPT